MVGILGLKRTYQELEFRKLTNVLQAGVFEKERPARESTADAPLKPLEASSRLPRERVNAGNLVIGVMRVTEGLWTRASSGQALDCLFDAASQSMQHSLEAYDQRFIRQELQRFSKHRFRRFPIPRHHVRLRSKINGVLVGRTFFPPRLQFFVSALVLLIP